MTSRARRLRDIFERAHPILKTVPIEEHNKVKEALETITTERDTLKQSNTQLQEEKESLRKEFDAFKAEYRHEIIASLYEGIKMNDELRNSSIDSFTKSKLTIEEIKWHINQLRPSHSKSDVQTGTKLPQKSIADKKNNFSYID